MIPFSKDGNVYALATLLISKMVNELQKLDSQARDSILEKPLADLQADILIALDKFQKHFGEHNV